MESLSDQGPTHGALRQRQAALFVPGQTPAKAPQLPGQRQQQERGKERGERGGQGRQHSKLSQGQHLLRAGPLPSIHLRLRAETLSEPCVKLLHVRALGILLLFLLFFLLFWCPVKVVQIKIKCGWVYSRLHQKKCIQLICGENHIKGRNSAYDPRSRRNRRDVSHFCCGLKLKETAEFNFCSYF